MSALALRFASGQELRDAHGNGIRCYVHPVNPQNKQPLTSHGVLDATTDPATIRGWWQRWPAAMVGVACGRSGLVAIDCDTYKSAFKRRSQHFAQRLAAFGSTIIKTPSGGLHFLFQSGGAQWGNATRTLPPAVDVRGVGGYVVGAGSVRADGIAYTWQHDAPVLPAPRLVRHMLDRENRKDESTSAPATKTTDYAPSRAPDADTGDYVRQVLDTWRPLDVFKRFGLDANGTQKEANGSTRILGHGGLIVAKDGERWYSHQSQCGGGAAEAWAWCTRRPLRNRGRAFMELIEEMGGAAGIAKPQRSPPSATIAQLREFLRDADFAEIVTHRDSLGRYRTRRTDRRVADAALAIMMESDTLIRRVSGLALSEKTGLDDETCTLAMLRLSPGLFEIIEGEGAPVYSIVAYIRTLEGKYQSSGCTQQFDNPLCVANGHDAFVRSMTNLTLDELGDRQITPALSKRLAADYPSAGPGVLLALDALDRHGDMTRAELSQAMHESKYSISRVVRRGVELGLLVEDGKRIAINPDWRTLADDLAPAMPTAGIMERRRYNAAQRRAQWAGDKTDSRSVAARNTWAALARGEGAIDPQLPTRHRPGADIGLRTDRSNVQTAHADAVYWRRLGSLTDNQRYYVQLA